MFVTGTIHAYGEENASNPLAAVSNTDLRYQFFDLDGSDRSDFWVDGLLGIGGDRPYDWGVGVGLRFKY